MSWGEAFTGFWWGNLRKEKVPLGGLRCRWEDNTKMDFQEVGCGEGYDLNRDGSE
jgi:hypothetical protein